MCRIAPGVGQTPSMRLPSQQVDEVQLGAPGKAAFVHAPPDDSADVQSPRPAALGIISAALQVATDQNGQFGKISGTVPTDKLQN